MTRNDAVLDALTTRLAADPDVGDRNEVGAMIRRNAGRRREPPRNERNTHRMAYNDAPEGWWQDFVSATPPRTCKLAVTRKDGSPHLAPVWVDLERGSGPGGEDVIVFMTSADTIKGKSILRDGRVGMCFDDDRPPFAFVTITGRATTTTDPDELLEVGTRIGGRYMGAELGDAYGRRNAVSPEMVVRVIPDRVIAKVDIAGFG